MESNFPIIVISVFILSSCTTTGTTTGTTQVREMSKDRYFAKQCFTKVKSEVFDDDGINQKALRNCKVDGSYYYSNLKSRPSEFSRRPEICRKDSDLLTYEERSVKQLFCNPGSYNEPYYATYYNSVEISCAQPWGEIIKNTYKCYLTDNGNVESWSKVED